MLVLLIIFMVTAPMLHQGISVALPKTATTNLRSGLEDPIVLSISKEGVYYINETPVARGLLRERLRAILRGHREKAVLLKADRGLVRPGMFADITVFNPATVLDRATFEKPHQTSVGIEYVLVNGQVVLRKGQLTSARPGRGLRGPGYQESR
jgi:hypothetical protein